MEINMLDILKIHDKFLDSAEKINALRERRNLLFNEVINHEPDTKEHNTAYYEYLQVIHDMTYENGYQKGLEKALNILGFDTTIKTE